MNSSAPICCVAGKSGGHIIPCLQLALNERSDRPSPIIFISTTGQLDQKIKAQFSSITDHLPLKLDNVPYKKWWRLPAFAWCFLKCILTSYRYLKHHKPRKIISTGGFISLPVGIAAWLLHIPIDLFELNVIPGKATSVVSTFSTNVFVCFKETQKYFKRHTTVKSYPLRFATADKQLSKTDAVKSLGLDGTKKTLCILGGSQGSEFLNNLIQRLPLPLLQQYNIIHQTGADQVQKCSDFYAANNITAQVFAFQANLIAQYQAADLVICRAGAGTLFELLFFEKKSLVIPLETRITDHQLDNAYALQKSHPELFSVLRQQDLQSDKSKFFNSITDIR